MKISELLQGNISSVQYIGIVDNQNSKPVEIVENPNPSQKLDFSINNKEYKEISLYPFDFAISMKDKNGNERSKCDLIFTIESENKIILCEMKDRKKANIGKATNQLLSSLEILSEKEILSNYKNKNSRYAYVSNVRGHRGLQMNYTSKTNSFWENFRTHLRVATCYNVESAL